MFHLNGYLATKLDLSVFASDPKLSFGYTVFSKGHWGVQLFFVISGFILLLPYINHPRSGESLLHLKLFYQRRFARIMPPYIINLTCLFAMLVCINHVNVLQLLPHYLASSLFVHHLVFGNPSVINYVAWALEIEIQFYLIAPFLGFLFLINSLWLRRGILILLALFFTFVMRMPSLGFAELAQGTLAAHIQYFLVGILLADIYKQWRKSGTKNSVYDLLGFAAWIVILSAPHVFGGGGHFFT